MRVSTCKYSRYKMKITTESGCSFCDCEEETLDHIFLECPVSSDFIKQLNVFITKIFDASYSDVNRRYLITTNHDNTIINYLNMSAKWYLSRSYQLETKPTWLGFVRAARNYLIGEKIDIKTPLIESLA